jgi:hypothetical protein
VRKDYRTWLLASTLGALAFGAGSAARAGTVTWNGNGGNSSWATGANWSTGSQPSTSDDVVVSGTKPVSLNNGATTTIKSLNVTGYSSTVTQSSATPFHVTGTFAISSGTFAASSSSTVQIDGASTDSGSGTFTSNGATVIMTGGLTVSGGTFSGNSATITFGSLSQSSGTFTGSNATITDTGNLSLTGGSFTATTGTMQVGGAFSHAAANTFNDNGGTMLFNATTSKSHTFGGATMPSVIINDGLAGYWTLDDGSGDPADSSGYGNALTRNGTTTYSATVPSAITFADADMLTFNGSTGYATDATPAAMPANNAAQTISLWAQFSSSTSTQAMLALTGSGSAVVLGLGAGNVRVWKSSTTDLAHVTAPTDGAWHHIAYSYDTSTDKLYVDGVLAPTLSVGHDSGATTAVFMGAASASTSFFNGSLDDVRVYTRALTAREIADLAFGHAPSTGVATHTFSDAFTTDNGNDLVIASGVVAGTAAVTVGGNWFNYGGRVTDTGTITLNCTGSRTLLSGGQIFSNLTVNSTGKYTTADRLWMPGATLNLIGQASSMSPSYPVTTGFLADSTPSNNGFQAGNTGTVILDGTTSQALAEKNFWGLRIEDPSETGIVAYWKLDEGQWTSVRDYSGSGNTGTLSATGSSWTSAPAGITFDDAAALKLDGSTGSVTLGHSGLPASNTAQTISLWVNLGSTTGTQDFLVLGDGSHGVKLGLKSGVLGAYTWGGTALITATTPAAGGWHNVVYSYDGTSKHNFYLDGVAVASTTTTPDSATVSVAMLGSSNGSQELFKGSLDDVRVYNKALTAAQIGQLAKGRYAGTGGVATVTQTNVKLNIPLGAFGLILDSGNYDANDQTVTVSVTSIPCIVSSGTLHIGSAVMNCDGGLTINPMGTLIMDATSNQFQPGKNSTVAIDGTFTASNTAALISRDNSGETYAFQVGTFSGSTPVLNITGLTVRFADANGLQIDNLAGTATGATTTLTHFDNITFRQGPSGGAQFLEVYSKSLFLSSSGCTFGQNGDSNFPAVAVKLIGNGTGDGETRAVFGGTTCQSSSGSWTGGGADKICVAAAKSDDDSDGNGVADSGTATTNGAIVQFLHAAEDDTAGSVVGLPTAAFNWNTFTYYSSYVAFRNASGGSSDVIYVRDELGNPLYSWTVPAGGGAITGTPQWISTTVGSVTTHYLYVATSAGNVYRLIDTGTGTTSGTLTLDASWPQNPFSCSCTITTPLGMDSTNLYWGTSTNVFHTLSQSATPGPQTHLTLSLSGNTVTNTGMSVATIGTTSAYMAVKGAFLQIGTAGNSLSATNSSPGATHSIFGRVVVGMGATKRVYGGDDGGTMWAIAPGNFAQANGLWHFTTANAIMSSPYYDNVTDTVQYGTQGGTIIVLTGSGALLNTTDYPYTPAGGTGDPITAAPLYNSGVLAVGSTKGKLYFLDRATGTSPSVKIIREYAFGASESVSGIGFDPTVNRYMVSTANSSTNDGRLYYIDLIADPTPLSL